MDGTQVKMPSGNFTLCKSFNSLDEALEGIKSIPETSRITSIDFYRESSPAVIVSTGTYYRWNASVRFETEKVEIDGWVSSRY